MRGQANKNNTRMKWGMGISPMGQVLIFQQKRGEAGSQARWIRMDGISNHQLVDI